MAEELRPFQRLQYAFAASIRDPQNNPHADVAPADRIQIYRQLIYNNLESFLSRVFPILKATLGGEAWSALVDDFLREHQSNTPYLFEIAEEFLRYLQDERPQTEHDPPFLLELAHYEWVELALEIAEDAPPPENSRLLKDPLSQTIFLSELAWPLVYRFPVHRIRPDFQPRFPPAKPSFLLVYRDRDDQVNFMEIGFRVYFLLEALRSQGPMQAAAAFAETTSTAKRGSDRAAVSRSRSLLVDLAQRAVIGASWPVSGATLA